MEALAKLKAKSFAAVVLVLGKSLAVPDTGRACLAASEWYFAGG
jgi:hypothetical protein